MSVECRVPSWIDLDGAVNARAVVPGVLVRADNLQGLSPRDVRRLVDDEAVEVVLDLRTDVEVELEGPSPMTAEPAVRIEHLSLYPDSGGKTDLDADTIRPWGEADEHEAPDERPIVRAYMSYLRRRPDSVVDSMRAIARVDGAVLVHCAAGKDRTGVVVALALDAAGVARDAIVRDYLATGQRIDAIMDRLVSSPTYRAELEGHDPQQHAPLPGTMERVLELVDQRFGGSAAWLSAHGLQDADLKALRRRLGPGRPSCPRGEGHRRRRAVMIGMVPEPNDPNIAYPSPRARTGAPARDEIAPHLVTIFGATGDLARRKLLPALARLSESHLAPELRVVGTSLDDLDDRGFQEFAHAAIDEFGGHRLSNEEIAAFTRKLQYARQSDGPEALAAAVSRGEEQLGDDARRLHYLSVPPRAAVSVIEMLNHADLVDRARVIMEKPFGSDLDSAIRLNARVHETFDESQIFRIDHFLGKEPAQNILAFRFANGLFEPIWNRNFIDHVQIDIPERLGLENRAQFYESTGAYRDMVVTHLLQVLAFIAIEPPTALEPRAISEEKNKVFRSLLPIDPNHVVRGQYGGYREEAGVSPHSDTETFIALRCELDNWRWAGVPFYLRTGKKMAEGQRIVSIAFREAPKSMFPSNSGVGAQGPDHLTFDLADASRLSLSFYGKRPGPGMRLDKLSMQFATSETQELADVLEAYERLILDTLRGDHTLFTTAEGIESLWERSIPLLENPPPVKPYAPGSWGPNAIHQLIAPNAWRLPFERVWRGK